MLPDQCIVLRDGTAQQVAGSQIVPGDVLCLKMGDKIPADVRFVEASNDAKFDRSILTGESQPLHWTVDSTDDNFLETACIGMAGTHCVSGTALGVVIATGDRTVFGRIAKLTSAPKQGLTPLQRELLYFISLIVGIMLVMIITVIIVWAAWLRIDHPGWITGAMLIVNCVSVAVAFIPEGLPIAITASLTITAKIMKRNNVLCKSLKTVETLGSVTVICSDKTGTLTKNEMRVTDYLIGKELLCADGEAKIGLQGPASEKITPQVSRSYQLALLAGFCNAGEFDAATMQMPLQDRKINGDATDQAVLRFAESLSSVAEMRRSWITKYRLAFNSKNKFMINVMSLDTSASTNSTEAAVDRTVLTIKGAPDILLPRCSTFLASDEGPRNILEHDRKEINTIKDRWSSLGKRVVLLARKTLPKHSSTMSVSSREYEKHIIEEASYGLELVGLVGIVDPLRREIPEVVRTLRGAGIKMFMVTGDFKLTAQAIATECGIVTNSSEFVDNVSALGEEDSSESIVKFKADSIAIPNAAESMRTIVLSGPELTTLNDKQWAKLCLYDEIVFARTTPEQKLRMVKELQARGEIVGSKY